MNKSIFRSKARAGFIDPCRIRRVAGRRLYRTVFFWMRQVLLGVCILAASVAGGATIEGNALLLTPATAQQIESWVGEGPITLTNVFTSLPGDGKTANDFHQVVDGLGRTVVVVEVPAQGAHSRKVIGGYNPQSWDSSATYHFTTPDSQRTGFLFNLSTSAVARQKLSNVDGGSVGSYQTYNDFNVGPKFGGGPDLLVDFGLHNGTTYGWSYGPSGFGVSILGGGQGDGGAPITYGTVEVYAMNMTAAAPKVITLDADSVNSTGATLNATVSANLSASQVVFRYSTDPTLASGAITTPAQTLPGTAFGTLVSRTISGLTPGTTYYYRAVATNALGTTSGAVQAFIATDASIGYRFGQIPAGNTGVFGGATFGSKFTVNQACILTHLGVYDHGQNGLAANTPVGLWDASGVLLASTTVSKTDSLYRNCRYHALSAPVALSANTRYYVGAYYAVSDVYGYKPSTFSTDPRITFNGFAYRTGSFTFPDERQGTLTDGITGYFGANFMVDALPVAPIADAGPDQTAGENAPIVLDGTGSRDGNATPKPLTYSWLQISGPSVALANATTATPNFTTPTAPPGGLALVFRLTVSNGSLTATDMVTVNVVKLNSPPVANAGPNQVVGERAMVTLDASLSSDVDGDPLTVQWSQISGPAVQLDDTGIANPVFQAPEVSAEQERVELLFQLVVNDGKASSGPSVVTIRVKNTNDAPTADAGVDLHVNELAAVTLNGSQSRDPDGNELSYSWLQIVGEPMVTLTGADTATPQFQAPSLDLGGASGQTTLTFQLTVSDGMNSDTATVNVHVSNVNHAPLADAGPDQTVLENSEVALDGSNSADIDGDSVTYQWEQTSGPAINLVGANTSAPTFVAPSAGVAGAALSFRLVASDAYGGVATDDVVVNVSHVNRPPVVFAGAPQNIGENESIALAGSASDPDANALDISWRQISGPEITLIGRDTLTPSFLAPAVTRAGARVVLRLNAVDDHGSSASSDAIIDIQNLNHAPLAQAPANFSVSPGMPVTLVGSGSDQDLEELAALAYSWTQTAGPQVEVTGSGATVEFTAPTLSAAEDTTVLTFRLDVTDPCGAAAHDEVSVTVVKSNHAPTAVAGGNLTVNEAATATLNASASSDPDGDALTYHWDQVSGPAVTLNDADSAYPYFKAPFVSDAGATLSFKLTVKDPAGNTANDVATVSVANANDLPVVTNARPSQSTLWPPDHRMVRITILGVVDANRNATIKITDVTQDEPTNGTCDGDTPVDAVISDDGKSVLLRAERSGRGDGRVYRVGFKATDPEGSVTGFVEVYVPKSKRSGHAGDDGLRCQSTR